MGIFVPAFFPLGSLQASRWKGDLGFPIAYLEPTISKALGSGQEENRTPMTARSPHFECGASTSFATRPWYQLSHYSTPVSFVARGQDILGCWPNGRFLAPAGLGRGG